MTVNAPTYMSLKEGAAFLGMSEMTLRRRVSDGTLRAVRIGPRAIRVRADDLESLARPIPTAGS